MPTSQSQRTANHRALSWSVPPGALVQAMRHGATPRVYARYATPVRCDTSRPGSRRWYRAAGPGTGPIPHGSIGRDDRMSEQADPSHLVDLGRYPVLRPDTASLQATIAAAREQMANRGATEIPGFLTPVGVETLVRDADALADRAHPSGGQGTAYLEFPDFSLPEDHPRLHFADYAVRAVAYDITPRSSPLRQLYEWDPLKNLIEAILGRGPIHRYADPFGALNLAVMGQGDQLQWHFDQTDFVVSLAIQSAEHGGAFEVAPRIRQADDEHYDDVRAVLDGDTTAVETLAMTPGTLLVFEGRHSLHRVSPIGGTRWRHVGLLAYDTKPGTMGSDLLRADRYGRTEPFAEPPERWPVPVGVGP
jgi:hypothetical protein